ncbi:hypothetical protein V6N11_005869 [Hibiscus sabdariffa]|uniref:Uncharacterized protein n=1 Tax=Hibiscus sabdariffa TaxID=183260 RepID=A0ABR2RPU3_9ROSI
MEVGEEEQKRNDEGCIEAPTEDPGAAGASEMVEDEHGHYEEASPKLQQLAIGDHFLPLGANPKGAHQVVSVHDNVHGAVGDEHHGERGLSAVHADVRHDDHHGVMVDVQKGEPVHGVAEDDQKGVHEFYDLGEDRTCKGRTRHLRKKESEGDVRNNREAKKARGGAWGFAGVP